MYTDSHPLALRVAVPIWWMARAAGGTSQRLKPGPAIVRSLSRNPGLAPGKSNVAVLLIVSPLRAAQGPGMGACGSSAAASMVVGVLSRASGGLGGGEARAIARHRLQHDVMQPDVAVLSIRMLVIGRANG